MRWKLVLLLAGRALDVGDFRAFCGDTGDGVGILALSGKSLACNSYIALGVLGIGAEMSLIV